RFEQVIDCYIYGRGSTLAAAIATLLPVLIFLVRSSFTTFVVLLNMSIGAAPLLHNTKSLAEYPALEPTKI
ncbi:hypothetical protein, partial [Mitsuokella jalaludinii]|uniref:hypothetical protein n=1 Tax=Mitsuokella jalaludinii TaxID=187979 RepID=UPI00308051B9